jgi:uncharacterized membrane protein
MTTGTDLAKPLEVERFLQDAFSESWRAFKADAALYVLGCLLAMLVSAVSLTILLGPMTVGFIKLVQRRRRGEQAHARDVLDGLSTLGAPVRAWLLVVLAMALGGVLLVLPGLLVMVVTCFAFHELAYRQRYAVDAIRESCKLVIGNFLHVLLLLIAIGLLNAVSHIVPIAPLLTAPFSAVLVTVAYEKLSGQTAALPLEALQPPAVS